MVRWLLGLVLIQNLFSLENRPFVEAELRGQLGNNLFIVATASALAWDNNAEVYFPELNVKYDLNRQNIPLNLAHIFFRCNLSNPPRPVANHWSQPTFAYDKIPFKPDMKIHGYLQSEKYFAHHRSRILKLFAPHPDDLAYIQEKYQWILEHPFTVGIHVRQNWENPTGHMYIQYGKDYLRKAMSLFSEKALFIMFSNDLNFVRENIPEELADRVVCIENEPHYIDLFLLSFCKDNIITNSTFGWWGAWLNQNLEKIVVAPKQWLHPVTFDLPTDDLFPPEWIRIDAKYGPLQDPTTYQ